MPNKGVRLVPKPAMALAKYCVSGLVPNEAGASCQIVLFAERYGALVIPGDKQRKSQSQNGNPSQPGHSHSQQ
jgi:hypothetical protein